MDHQARGRKEPRRRQPWAYGILVHPQLIMIPAKSGTQSPVSVTNQIFYVTCLLEIRAIPGRSLISRKCKRQRRLRIELRRIRNYIAEVCLQECIVRFDTRLEFVPAVMNGHRTVEVIFTKVVMQESD